MAGINKVILVGNLGNDVEMKYTTDGRAIANLSIATSDNWTDRNTGQKQEKTEWHRVSIFGKLAEIANQYLHKGSKVYVEGKLQTTKYTKDGVERYSTSIMVTGFDGTLQMLDKRENSGDYSGQNTAPANNTNHNPAPPPAANNEQVKTIVEPDDFEDDIPF